MSGGGQGRASLGVEVRKSSQNWSVQRSVVRSIAWLGLWVSRDSMLLKIVGEWKLETLVTLHVGAMK